MKPQDVLSALEGAARGLGIKVSYEALAVSVGIGGLCRVRGEPRIIIDKRAATADRIAAVAGALAGFDLAGIALPAPARTAIARHSATAPAAAKSARAS